MAPRRPAAAAPVPPVAAAAAAAAAAPAPPQVPTDAAEMVVARRLQEAVLLHLQCSVLGILTVEPAMPCREVNNSHGQAIA